jgi:ketosteroid isomerase-like protein
MQSDNVAIVRTAYEAYARGDLETMLAFVDPDLEWTYLDPSLEAPEPQVCHGRVELENALVRWAEHGFHAELEEIAGDADRVMVCVRTPGIADHRKREGDERSYVVLTVRDGQIVALRDCRDRDEARALAGVP